MYRYICKVLCRWIPLISTCSLMTVFISLAAKSFLEIVPYLFSLPGVKSFLSQRICQDPLEKFFGCQRHRGGTHDNPTAAEFYKNTQALRVVNNVHRHIALGNCRGGMKEMQDKEKENSYGPMPKRRCIRHSQ